jgi:hypothetical protein
MKYQRILLTLSISALPCAGLFAAEGPQNGKPTVITPPAINNGSNWSRAPFPAQRKFDDVKPADGLAVDNLPPNSESANTEPPVPASRVAILQGATAPATTYAATTTVDPSTQPTGRTTTYTTATTPATTVAVDVPGSRPTVITPPAIPDGSNASRAPFPAERKFDDVKPADGLAIDKTGANSESGNVEPAAPATRVAIMQPATSTTVATTTAVDPSLQPTGRSNMAVAAALEAPTFAPTIRAATHDSRDQMVADIEHRLTATESSLATMRGTASAMSTDGRRAFENQENTVKEKAKALRKSIKAAQKASASEWDNARAQLAADFDAYAAAVGQIDATAGR